mgnify:CR=1 FL=1
MKNSLKHKLLNTHDVLEKIVKEAKKNGATEVDAMISKTRGLSVSIRNGKEETIERYDSFDIGLRVFVGKRNSIISTNLSSENHLKDFATKAVEMAKIAPEDKYCKIATNELLEKYPINMSLDLQTYDKTELTVQDLKIKALDTEEYALAISKKLKSDGAESSWGQNETTLMTSNGFLGKKKKSVNSISSVMIAKKSDKMERDYDFSSKIFVKDLDNPKLIGEKAGNNALSKLGSIKPKTGTYPVMFVPRVARSVLGHIASALNGASIARGTSFLKDCFKKQVFSKDLNIIDNPILRKGPGSRLFDGEGIGTREIRFINAGVLDNWLLDIGTGIQLNMETNGNAVRGLNGPPSPGTSNFILLPGKYTPNELMKDIKEGFLITELIGSSVSLITGDYSRGASGFWIKNGQISHPISEATIAGNLKDIFQQIIAANDIDYSFSLACPTLMIEKMVVAGS